MQSGYGRTSGAVGSPTSPRAVVADSDGVAVGRANANIVAPRERETSSMQ